MQAGTGVQAPRLLRGRGRAGNGEGGACLEVADGFPSVTPVRDSKRPEGPTLLFGADGWAAFVDAVREGSL
ncbi:DUF397 domain-containing protein [Streptomyces sp. V1I1]|uniref:DUF397 domain-containing protein n=1 Tax=Streptomyces sp. V1I1 TaxID=3042272 RepID=UPI0027D8E5A4|nr:DUF397 domain-containing protein [Streptomyces sp. V1I1]